MHVHNSLAPRANIVDREGQSCAARSYVKSNPSVHAAVAESGILERGHMWSSTGLGHARREEWLLLGALLASFPLGVALPAAWAREGGALENAQVAVLLAGAVAALLAYLRLRPHRSAMLGTAAAPLWLLLAGRELSWGRVLAPVLLDSSGAVSAGLGWYRLGGKAAALMLLAVACWNAWRFRVDRTLHVLWAGAAPWIGIAVIVGAAIGSTCAEGHMSCSLDLAPARAQVVEELCELVAYIGLFSIQATLLRTELPLARPAASGRTG